MGTHWLFLFRGFKAGWIHLNNASMMLLTGMGPPSINGKLNGHAKTILLPLIAYLASRFFEYCCGIICLQVFPALFA